MNLLARLMSHGFAIGLVILLAIGFVYRGELFPEWELPGFLAFDSGNKPETAREAGKVESVPVQDDWLASGTGSLVQKAPDTKDATTLVVTAGTPPVEELVVPDSNAISADTPVVEDVVSGAVSAGTGISEAPVTGLESEPADAVVDPVVVDTATAEPPEVDQVVEAGNAVPPEVDTIVADLADDASPAAMMDQVPAGDDMPGIIQDDTSTDIRSAGEAAGEPASMMDEDVVAPVETMIDAAVDQADAVSPPIAGDTGTGASPAAAVGTVIGEPASMTAADETSAMPAEASMEDGAVEQAGDAIAPPTGNTGVADAGAPVEPVPSSAVVIKTVEAPAPAASEEQAPVPHVSADLAATPYRLLAAAREAYWLHDYQAAEDSYRQLISNDPDNPDGYGELANMYFSQGNWEAAVAAYYQAGLRLVKSGLLAPARDLVDVIRGLNGSQADALEGEIQAAQAESR